MENPFRKKRPFEMKCVYAGPEEMLRRSRVPAQQDGEAEPQKPYPFNRAEPDEDAPLMPPSLPPQMQPAMALVYAGPDAFNRPGSAVNLSGPVMAEMEEVYAGPEILNGVACPSCGAMNEAGSKFCMNCGTKLP